VVGVAGPELTLLRDWRLATGDWRLAKGLRPERGDGVERAKRAAERERAGVGPREQ